MSKQHQIGQHTLEIRDDMQILTIRGVVTEDDVRLMIPISETLTAKNGYFVSITDAQHAGSMTPSARRLNAEWFRDHPEHVGISIVHSTSTAVRVLVSLVTRATALLSKRPFRIEYVTDEAAALALAEVERPRLRAEALRRSRRAARNADSASGAGPAE